MTDFSPILAHFIGDVIFQSDWMATEKTKRLTAAFAHVSIYGLVFWLLVRPPLIVLVVIVGTHFAIDHWRLARHVGWLKNFIAPPKRVITYSKIRVSGDGLITPDGLATGWRSRQRSWRECSQFGYPPETPRHLAEWLMIWTDQIMHLVINYLALRYLT